VSGSAEGKVGGAEAGIAEQGAEFPGEDPRGDPIVAHADDELFARREAAAPGDESCEFRCILESGSQLGDFIVLFDKGFPGCVEIRRQAVVIVDRADDPGAEGAAGFFDFRHVEIAFEIDVGEIGARIGTGIGEGLGDHHEPDAFPLVEHASVAFPAYGKHAGKAGFFREGADEKLFCRVQAVGTEFHHVDHVPVSVQGCEVRGDGPAGEAEADRKGRLRHGVHSIATAGRNTTRKNRDSAATAGHLLVQNAFFVAICHYPSHGLRRTLCPVNLHRTNCPKRP
jgi:hypothetical protein